MISHKKILGIKSYFYLKIGLLTLFLLIISTPHVCCSANTYRVTKVYSGDKIKVTFNGGQFIVKLAGIQAPIFCQENTNLSQPLSLESRRYLEGLILNKNIHIKPFTNKEYNITIAEVFLGNQNINLEMLKAGLAQTLIDESSQGLDMQTYKQVEYQARIKKLGIWGAPDTHEPPIEWLKRQEARTGCSMILLGILQGSGGILK